MSWGIEYNCWKKHLVRRFICDVQLLVVISLIWQMFPRVFNEEHKQNRQCTYFRMSSVGKNGSSTCSLSMVDMMIRR